MNMSTTKGHTLKLVTRFYQSGISEELDVDFDDMRHVQLFNLVYEGQVPSPEANKLMKEMGFKPSTHNGRDAWSSDLFLVIRDVETGKVYEWVS